MNSINRKTGMILSIAAAFCMFNRYVDGLATWAPMEREYYIYRAKQRAEEGDANCEETK